MATGQEHSLWAQLSRTESRVNPAGVHVQAVHVQGTGKHGGTAHARLRQKQTRGQPKLPTQ